MGHQFLIPHQALLFCIADTQFVMAGKSNEYADSAAGPGNPREQAAPDRSAALLGDSTWLTKHFRKICFAKWTEESERVPPASRCWPLMFNNPHLAHRQFIDL
jgi:hypothetical protein